MKFYSTNNHNLNVTFRDALFNGMPIDNGLYMPEQLPDFSNIFKKDINLSLHEIAVMIASKFLDDDLDNNDIQDIISNSINFPAPNIPIDDNIFCLELFHGPTFAFKDFGARFMARCMEKFIAKQNKNINILVATSGDTGSAVANGFYNVEGINVIILYPSGKVSCIQEKQLTTLDNNIFALEVDGTFDDCQKLVKRAFLDIDLKNSINISSANSINIARLIPQTFYYFHSFMQMNKKDNEVVFCVPSGNFGNITAGVMAKHMGLPIKKLIAATNANDIVPEFFKTSIFNPRPSIRTMSNAMDVGHPSNMERLLNIYTELIDLKEDMLSWAFSDEQTSDCIFKYKDYYLLDPHSAIGLLGLLRYFEKNKCNSDGVFLGTAHPAKFADIIEPIIDTKVEIPESLSKTINKKKNSILIKNNYKEFYDYLMSTFQ